MDIAILLFIPLNFKCSLFSMSQDVGVTNNPEEGEENDAAGQDSGVELDTPDTGGHGWTSEQDGHPVIA